MDRTNIASKVAQNIASNVVVTDEDLALDADDAVGRGLVAAHREVAASTVRMFDLISDLEKSEGYLPVYANTSSWLRRHLRLTGRTARLWVRIARQFGEFPQIRAAFASAVISLDQAQLLVRIATADNQADLVALAAASSDIDELRAVINDRAQAASEEAAAAADPRDSEPSVRTWWRDDTLHVRGTVPGADGVMVETAMLRLADRTPKDEQTGLFRDPDLRMGEALVQMASESLADDGNHDRATVVVHIPATDLVAGEGDGWDAASRIFTAGELARLVCDARLQPALHDSGGVTVGVGRTTRTIEPWLRRLVEGRDQGCRFPACEQTRWLHCHHIIQWADLGPTNLDNLVSLCGFHHRLIHNYDWTIAGDPNRELQFYNQWGRPHTPPPDRFPPDWAATAEKHRAPATAQRLAEMATATPP